MTCPKCQSDRVRVIRELFAPNDPHRARWWCDECEHLWPFWDSGKVFTNEATQTRRRQ